MEKFIPYKKLFKKKQRELNARKRKTWDNVNPVTRRTENPKAYNGQKARKWSNDSSFVPFNLYITISEKVDFLNTSLLNSLFRDLLSADV